MIWPPQLCKLSAMKAATPLPLALIFRQIVSISSAYSFFSWPDDELYWLNLPRYVSGHDACAKKEKENAINRWPRRLWWVIHHNRVRPGTYHMNIIRFGISAGQIEFVRRYLHQGSQMSVISAARESEKWNCEIESNLISHSPNHNNNNL